jgi:hypothetical protein
MDLDPVTASSLASARRTTRRSTVASDPRICSTPTHSISRRRSSTALGPRVGPNPHLAWEQAATLPPDNDRVWAELAKAYEAVDPLAVLPIHRRLVEHELVNTDAKHYRNAARRLAKMRTVSRSTKDASWSVQPVTAGCCE